MADVVDKCGTPSYIDPSVLKGGSFTNKSDIFSLGSLFFNLITGKFLFSGRNPHEMLFNNTNIDP